MVSQEPRTKNHEHQVEWLRILIKVFHSEICMQRSAAFNATPILNHVNKYKMDFFEKHVQQPNNETWTESKMEMQFVASNLNIWTMAKWLNGSNASFPSIEIQWNSLWATCSPFNIRRMNEEGNEKCIFYFQSNAKQGSWQNHRTIWRFIKMQIASYSA